MNINDFTKLLFSSKRYEFNSSILEITDYYTGESVKLDLSKITEEVLEELIADEDEFEDDYYE